MKNRTPIIALCVLTLAAALTAAEEKPADPSGKKVPEISEKVRAGIIGLDTSHGPVFTALFNDPKNPEHVPGVQVVAAFPGGSPDLPDSANRVEKYTAEVKDKWSVEIVADIPTLCQKVDAVLLLSVDGRRHLDQARQAIAGKKPMFIDKPMAASLADAREIFRLAAEARVPVFSSSALRFIPSIAQARTDVSLGGVMGCAAYSPCPLEPHHPDLFWYGIHGVEILYTIMGPGCESVVRVHTDDSDLVVGRWKDGRIGSFRGLRKGVEPSGALVFGEKRMVRAEPEGGSIYRPLLLEMAKFFHGGPAPVSAEETLELLAFMEAADASKKDGGRPAPLAAK
jgi:predicted dehydrogenase